MSRKLIIWVGSILVLITAFIIIVVTVVTQPEPTEEALSFCDKYPETVFCTQTDYTETEIATDMFTTFIQRYPSLLDEDFCNSYFTGNLASYCMEDSSALVPMNFNSISKNFEIVPVEDLIFDIRTIYGNETIAYTFRIALNNMDGAYHISGLSYYTTPERIDLELTEEDINTFMLEFIAAMEDNGSDVCQEYLTWQAKYDCEQADDYISNYDLTFNYQVTLIDINTYEYLVTSEDESESVLYTITFEEVETELRIGHLSTSTPQESTTE